MICSMLRLTAAPRLSVHTVGSASLPMGLHAAARLACAAWAGRHRIQSDCLLALLASTEVGTSAEWGLAD